MKLTKKEIFSIPNVLGYLRVLLLPLIMWIYFKADSTTDYVLAGGLFLFSAILDFLDGQIARRFHMVTDLGKMVDPVADKLTQAAVAVCLATRYPLMIPLLLLMTVKELYMGIRGIVHLSKGGEVYGASLWGKGCTALIFLTFCILLFIPSMPLLYANLLILLSMVGMLITLFLYVRHFRRFRLGEASKRRPIRNLFLIILLAACVEFLYLAVGAVTPFVLQKKISANTENAFSVEDVLHADTVGERVMLLEENKQALYERIRLLNMAEERIILSTFDIREGKAIRDIAAVLLDRAEAGVQVMLLVDAFSFELHMGNNPLMDALTSHKNIEMRLYNPINALTPWTSQGRMHDKYFIVDDFAYAIGGRNTFDYFLTNDTDKGSFDREVLLYMTAPSTYDSLHVLLNYFQDIWNSELVSVYRDDEALIEKSAVQAERKALCERLSSMKQGEYKDCFLPYDYTSVTYPADSVALLNNPTHIYGKEPTLFYQLTELMKHAKSRVSIHTPYAVMDTYMLKRMREVVVENPDVSVTMMLNGVENGDNFVASADYLYHKKDVLSTGMRVLEYQGGTSYHGKTVLIDDDISIVGSFNFDMRSTYIDTELMLVVRSKGLNEELSALFQRYEGDACVQFSDGEQDVPEDITLTPISIGRDILNQFFGLILQPLRFLL